MIAPISFFDALLRQARRNQQADQPVRASASLAKLLSFPDLPAESAAEAHTRTGELHLKARRYAKARRHLRAALRLAPDSARLHHRLALTLSRDPAGSDTLAFRHYRRAMELEPGRTRWRGEAGLLAIRLGRTDDGLALLRQAADNAPTDVDALSRLVKGLCQTGRPEEALRLVRHARFASPCCQNLRQLEVDLLLARLRRDQELTAADLHRAENPVLLPFLPTESTTPAGQRYDGPQTLPGPHRARISVRPGCKRQ